MNFVLHGHAVSTGITIGYAHLVSTARMEVGHYEVPAEDLESEVERFDAALLRVLTSRNGALAGAVQRALSGGAEGVVHMNSDRCLDA